MSLPRGAIILGPDRSGTSLTASVVSALGIQVASGTRRDEFNLRGYWEDEETVRINEQICTAIGVNPLWAPPPEFDWTGLRSVKRQLPAAKAVVQRLEAETPWACKDPKFCLTLPFWKPLFHEPPRYLINLRNPLSVARSLARRDGFKVPTSGRFWFLWMRNALSNTLGESRLIVPYEEYFEEGGRSQLDRIAHFLGRFDSTLPDDLLSTDLDHGKATISDLKQTSSMPAETQQLYLGLRDAFQDPKLVDQVTESLRRSSDQEGVVETTLRVLAGGFYNRLGVTISKGLHREAGLFHRY